MVIEALDTEYFGKEKPSIRKGSSKEDFIQLQLIEEYIAIVNAYLKTLRDNHQKDKIQNREQESAIKAKKSSSKGEVQAQMEDFAATNQGRSSGNSYVAKASSSDATISVSGESSSTGASFSIGPSYA